MSEGWGMVILSGSPATLRGLLPDQGYGGDRHLFWRLVEELEAVGPSWSGKDRRNLRMFSFWFQGKSSTGFLRILFVVGQYP